MTRSRLRPESRLEFFLRPFELSDAMRSKVMERVHHAKVSQDDPFVIMIAAEAIYEYRIGAYLSRKKNLISRTELATKALVADVERAIHHGIKYDGESRAQLEKRLRKTVDDAADRLQTVTTVASVGNVVIFVISLGMLMHAAATVSPLFGRGDAAAWVRLMHANTHDMSTVLEEYCRVGGAKYFTAKGAPACDVPMRLPTEAAGLPAVTRISEFARYHLWIIAPVLLAGFLLREACRCSRTTFSRVVSRWRR